MLRKTKPTWFIWLVFFVSAVMLANHTKASTITSLAATLTDTTASATTSYTVTFTNGSIIPTSGGRINLYISGVQNAYSMSFYNATLDATTSPSSINIYSRGTNYISFSTSSDIAAGSSISIKINNVVNPDRAGYYFPRLYTTVYGTDLDGSSNWGGDYLGSYFTIGTVNVKGQITDGSNNAVPYANYSLYRNSGDYGSYYGYTDKNGWYGVGGLTSGSYTLYIYPPGNATTNYMTPDALTVTVDANNTVTANQSFVPATKTISGQVIKSGGGVATDANVYAYRMNGSGGSAYTTTDSNGNYTLNVSKGTWSLYVSNNGSNSTWSSCGNSYYTIVFSNDNSIESKTQNITVKTLDATVSGQIKKPDGTAPNQYSASFSLNSTDGCWYSPQVAVDGSFSMSVVAGTYSANGWSSDSALAFPTLANFTVSTGETKDLGTLTLVAKNEHISGTITDTNGAAVSGASVSAWKQNGGDWSSVTTDGNGSYTLNVIAGTYQVSAWPDYQSNYVYSGQPSSVTVTAGVTATKNFTFQKATNTLTGTIVDANGNTLSDVWGWIGANDGSNNWSNIGASISQGTFTLKIPSGTWTLYPYIYSDQYGAGDSKQVTFSGDNQTQTTTLTVVPYNSTISGTVYDEDGNKVTGQYMSIYATKGRYGAWRSANFNTATGTYSVTVSSGTWRLGWWTDMATTGYGGGVGQDISVAIGANETKTQDITLKKANATIKGTAYKTDGTTVPWAWITVDSREAKEKTGNDDLYYGNGASSNSTGVYEVKVPAGTYWVGGHMWTGSGLINPQQQKITVAANETASVDLTFRTADATISGNITKDGSGLSAYVTAWSEDGGYSETTSSNNGYYSLAVSSGTVWHVRAIYQDGQTVYKSVSETVDLTTSTEVSQDLFLLEKDFTLPQTQTVTFDASQTRTVSLADNTAVTIPASSLASSGNVTVTAEADARLPEELDNKPLDYGVNLTAVDSSGTAIENFQSNVVIEIPYTDSQLADNGVNDANDLRLAYYDDSVSTWQELTNSTVDTDNKTVTASTSHFTFFALVAAADQVAPNASTNQRALAGDGKIVLSWTNPSAADYASQKIYRSTTSGQLGDLLAQNVANTEYIDYGLTNGATYYYTIRSVDTAGNTSTNTNQVSATPSVAAGTLPETGQTANSWLLLLSIILYLFGRRLQLSRYY